MEKLYNLGESLSWLIEDNKINNKKLSDDIGVHVVTIQRWKRNAKYLFLGNLLKLADYFHCSLEFLVGRTDTQLDYTPRECPPFYQRIREVMDEKGKTSYRMNKETKIKYSYFTKWKSGKEPHVLTLIEAEII